MQFFTLLTLFATALAAESISVVLIRSGSQYQYNSPASDGANVLPSGNNKLKLVLNDDGTLVDTSTHKYINVGQYGYVTLTTTSQKGYSLGDGYLEYGDESAFGVLDNKVAFGATSGGFIGTPWKVVRVSSTAEVSVSNATNGTAALGVPVVAHSNGASSLRVFGVASVASIVALLL